MKTLFSITTMFALVATLHAQNSETRNLGEFTAIDVNTAATINLIQSDSDLVTVHSKNDLHLISTKVEDGVLKIRSTGGVTCDVRIKNLKAITAHDAAVITSENTLNVSDLSITESDASNINLMLNAKSVVVVAKDASVLKLSGNASKLNAVSEDGSDIKATDMKTDTVTVVASDGGIAKTWAVNKITAKASDGGNVHYKGTPADKNTSAEDGGIIKSDDGVTLNTDIEPQDTSRSFSLSLGSNKKSHHFSDGFIGFGYVSGPEHAGSRVMYGRSREFNFGFGGGYKFCKWNGIGADIYYKSTDYFLEPDADKVLPSPVIHSQEKLAFNNIGGLVFDRFYFGKMFLDGGIYYDWIFTNRDVAWDYPAGAGFSSVKTIERNLSFVNPTDYGLKFRFGAKDGISFYFNYRMANLFEKTTGATSGPSELPPYVLGINIGGF